MPRAARVEFGELLPRRGHEVVTLSRKDLDIGDVRAVKQGLKDHALITICRVLEVLSARRERT